MSRVLGKIENIHQRVLSPRKSNLRKLSSYKALYASVRNKYSLMGVDTRKGFNVRPGGK